VSNAMYLRPTVGYKLLDDLDGQISVIAAKAAKLADADAEDDSYGTEVDIALHYTPIENFKLSGTGGIFLPGSIYTSHSNEELGGDFDKPAFGARVIGSIHF